MESEENYFSNEEEVRGKLILPFINSLGIKQEDIELEKSFKIKLGKTGHVIDRKPINARADILCKKGDTNLFILELKSENNEITKDDIDQGISYARLLDQIAPFVIVSNGVKTLVIDTITKEELNGTAISEHSFRKNGFEISIHNDINLKREAVEYFIGYSQKNVEIFSKMQNEEELSKLIGNSCNLNKKYIPEIFLRRSDIYKEFERFKCSENKAFAILGESGVGKTNVICDLVQEVSKENIALFYNGSFLDEPIFERIRSDFNWIFSSQSTEVELIKNLDNLTYKTNKKLYIFIDAIDEIPSEKRVTNIDNLCKRIERFKNIKICISCKENAWDEFMKIRSLETRTSVLTKENSHRLKRFNTFELNDVIDKYKKMYNLKGDFSHELKKECALGFTLKIISEVYCNECLPETIDRIEIFNEYIEAKSISMNIESKKVKRILSEIGKYICNNKENNFNRVKETEIEKLIGEEIPTEFYEYNLLQKEKKENTKTYIGFYYSKISDYIIAICSHELDDKSGKSLEEAIRKMKQNASGISSLLWFETYATSKHRKAFLCIKEEEAMGLVSSYEKILNNYFKKIKNKFEPYTFDSIGIAIDNENSPFVHSYGFYSMEGKQDKVIQIDYPINSNWHGLGIKSVHTKNLKLHKKIGSEKVTFSVEDIIFEQLEKIVKNGELYEGENVKISIEKLLNLVYFYGKKIDMPQDNNSTFIPKYNSILPLDLNVLEYKVKLLNAKKYFKDVQLEELIENGTIQTQKNGNMMSYSYKESDFNYDIINKNALDALERGLNIPIFQGRGDSFPFLPILTEINLLKNKGINTIYQEILTSPDISTDRAREILKNKNLSSNDIGNIYYGTFSKENLKMYFQKLFTIFLNEYLEMIKSNFDLFKNEFEFYKEYPLEIEVEIQEDFEYARISISFYSSEQENIVVKIHEKGNFDYDFSKYHSMIVRHQGGISNYFSQGYSSNISISKIENTHKADEYCIIRDLVYRRILEELKESEKIIKEKIRSEISN